ncbi:MAG: flagellar hook-basal body complex protein FliE [Limnohabitans sp.]
MIERATSAANIHSMLQTLRTHQAQASGLQGFEEAQGAQGTAGTPKTGFSDLVSNAVSQVNNLQLQSRQMQDAYDRGEQIALTDVVIGMQKSAIAFEATLQVRNKVLKAYEDILNMPV